MTRTRESDPVRCPLCDAPMTFSPSASWYSRPYEYRCSECWLELLGPHPETADAVEVSRITRLLYPLTKLRVLVRERISGWFS